MLFKKSKSKQHKSLATGQIVLGSRERRLLSETVQIEEELIPAFVRPILIVVGLMVGVFLLWSGVTQLTEVARAPGEVLPSGQVKVIQHLDGGVIEKISVEENMLVKEGQELLRIDGSQAIADLRQMESRLLSLRLRAERLESFADGRKPKFDEIAGTHTDLRDDQNSLYQTQMATRDSTISILDRQIQQRKNRIKQLNQSFNTAGQQQGLTAELEKMRDDLAERKLINRSVLLETKRAKVTADGEVIRIKEEIGVVSQELAEIENRRSDTFNQVRRDALNEMGTVRAEIAEVEETLQRLQAKVDRLVVRSPNNGHVQDLKVQTIGQVIQPGALLMQIVPVDAPLEAVVKIPPKDIGYVKIGQPVNLRVTSFDYARFGIAKGTLKRVTATSIIGEDNKPYYRGWVSVKNPYVGDIPGRYPLKTGMSLEAEIVTGEKTLIAYLSKPLIDLFTYSFRER
ncbi:MAG: HlyD family type I secretion periplasmic adaptor subunit [Sulfuricella sp.]|nr:HlyD family type I secretion periplasmic adaptor subunit [Sulfuricella sp.]